jgi:hypothetical protein
MGQNVGYCVVCCRPQEFADQPEVIPIGDSVANHGFCSVCGNEMLFVTSGMKRCKCGHKNPPNSTTCGRCGNQNISPAMYTKDWFRARQSIQIQYMREWIAMGNMPPPDLKILLDAGERYPPQTWLESEYRLDVHICYSELLLKFKTPGQFKKIFRDDEFVRELATQLFEAKRNYNRGGCLTAFVPMAGFVSMKDAEKKIAAIYLQAAKIGISRSELDKMAGPSSGPYLK